MLEIPVPIIFSDSEKRRAAFRSAMGKPSADIAVSLPPQLDEKLRVQQGVLAKGIPHTHEHYSAYVAGAKLERAWVNYVKDKTKLGERKHNFVSPGADLLLFSGDTVQRYQDDAGIWQTLEKPHNFLDFFRMAQAQSGRPIRLEAAIAVLSVPTSEQLYRNEMPWSNPGLVLSRTSYVMREISRQEILAYSQGPTRAKILGVAGGLSFSSEVFENHSQPVIHSLIDPMKGETFYQETLNWQTMTPEYRLALIYGGFGAAIDRAIKNSQAKTTTIYSRGEEKAAR